MVLRPLFASLALLAVPAAAQQPQQGADYRCLSLTYLADKGHGGTTLHVLAQQLPQALAACGEGVKIRPREGRMASALGRVQLMAGDSRAALESAQQAAALGEPEGKLLLGVLLARSDPARALALFREAARAQQRLANYDLAVLWVNGLGTNADPQDAANFMRLAALGGDAMAMMVLGQWYAQGRGVAVDRAQAEAWWRKGAEVLVPEGAPDPLRLALGAPLLDEPAMLAWYRQQAGNGEAWAQAWIGQAYESGQWVARDEAAAAFWYRKAALAGQRDSQLRLANLYRQGRGVPQDEAEARRWGQMPQLAQCERRLAETAGQDDCDRYAADPYEPGRKTPGSDMFCLQQSVKQAVAACQRSVAREPQSARLRAQYARALAYDGRYAEARREASTAAGQGSTPAMILLGVMSQRGLGPVDDGRDALHWYRQAAEAGDRRGAMLMQVAARQGVGVAAGSAEANALDAEARERMVRGATVAPDRIPDRAAQGDPRSQHEMAVRAEMRKDYPGALQWYAQAARQGYAPSALNLAQMYEKGIGVPPDLDEAIARYTVLADQGDAEARYRLAVLQLRADKLPEAIQRLRKGVDHEDARAMVDLGQLYEQGRGVPPDAARAAALYQQAAPQSNWAKARLGAMALAGTGMPRDYAKARQWLEAAAAAGDGSAHNNLGWMDEKGWGGPVDLRRARDHYLAALYDAPEARGNLEQLYERDLGAPPDAAQATDWYRPAATAGIAAAQWRLARRYQQGHDEGEALRWLDAAAQQGYPPARQDAAAAWYARAQRLAGGAARDEAAERDALFHAAALGQPQAIVALRARFGASVLPGAPPAPPPWGGFATGISTAHREDPSHKLQVRVMSGGSAQAMAMDAGLASPYVVIPWSEQDRKRQAPGRP
jgi:TPR repeat protein